MQALAEALAAVGSAADAVASMHEALEGSGVRWLGHLGPVLAMGWMRGSDPDSRVNLLVDEICEGYAVEVARPALTAELARRERAAKEEGARQTAEVRAGRRVSAGPDGVVRPWDAKPKPDPMKRMQAAAAAVWERVTAASPSGVSVRWRNVESGELSDTPPARPAAE